MGDRRDDSRAENQIVDPDELERQIQAHRERKDKESYLGRAADLLTGADEESLGSLEKLRQEIDTARKAGDQELIKGKEKEIAAKVEADRRSLAWSDEVTHYTTGFGKTAALFMGGKIGLAGTVALYALDQMRPHDSMEQQLAGFGLGAAKGGLMKGAFTMLGNRQVGVAAKGVGLGVSSRLIDIGLSSDTYKQGDGSYNLGSGLKKTLFTSLAPTNLAADVVVFGAAHGLTGGINRLSGGAVERLPFVSTTMTGAAFGLSSGATGEIMRQKSAGESFDLGLVVKRSLIQAALDGVAAGPGGMQAARKFDAARLLDKGQAGTASLSALASEPFLARSAQATNDIKAAQQLATWGEARTPENMARVRVYQLGHEALSTKKETPRGPESFAGDVTSPAFLQSLSQRFYNNPHQVQWASEMVATMRSAGFPDALIRHPRVVSLVHNHLAKFEIPLSEIAETAKIIGPKDVWTEHVQAYLTMKQSGWETTPTKADVEAARTIIDPREPIKPTPENVGRARIAMLAIIPLEPGQAPLSAREGEALLKGLSLDTQAPGFLKAVSQHLHGHPYRTDHATQLVKVLKENGFNDTEVRSVAVLETTNKLAGSVDIPLKLIKEVAEIVGPNAVSVPKVSAYKVMERSGWTSFRVGADDIAAAEALIKRGDKPTPFNVARFRRDEMDREQ